VVPVSELGGVARHILDVAAVGLPGWRLIVLCPEGELAHHLRDAGAAVVTGPFGPAAGFAASVRTLRRHAAAVQPDVVHAHLAYADIVAAAARMWTGARLATTEHGIAALDSLYHATRWRARFARLVHHRRLRGTDVAIAVSKATKRAMVQKWRPRTDPMVIPNGVDVPAVRHKVAARRSGSEGICVLSLSRLSPEKRLPELLHAFAELHRAAPDARLIVAGEGPERAAAEAMAKALGLEGAVSFPGFADSTEAMGNADVIVQLSAWENCSYTLLDAVAAGLGVVATPVGGNPEILPRDCLAPAGDARAVAAAIVRQAENDARPGLPDGWPTREDMAARIAAAYGMLL
jgi:glycosyltransferase involved in cell wall biosynthesis